MSRSESLGQRLALMKAALDKESVGIALLSFPELRYSYVNPAMVRLLGTNPAGRLHAETAMDVPWSITSKLRAVGENGRPLKVRDSRWIMPRVPGAEPEELYFTLEVSRVVVGETAFVLSTAVETTDEVEARTKLDALVDRMNVVLDSVSEAIFSLDHHWRLTYANERAAEYFGRPKETLLHRAFGDLFGEFEAHALEKRLRPAMEQQEPIDSELLLPSCGTLHRVRAFPTGKGVAVYLAEVPTADGDGVARRDDERVKALMGLIDEGACLLGIGLRCEMVNDTACRLLEMRRDELVGRTVPEIFSDRMSEEWCAEVVSALEERRSFRTVAAYDERGYLEFCGVPFEGGSVLLIKPARKETP